MATVVTSWLTPGTVSGWTNSANVGASDNTYATASVTGWLTQGANLLCSNFGLSIPAGATVTNVECSIEGFYTNTNSVTPNYANPDVSFRKDVGNLSSGTSGGPSITSLMGTTEAVRTYSGATSTITVDGGTMNTWTPAEYNASTFGLVVPCAGTVDNASTGGTLSYSIDQVRIRVTYDDPSQLGAYSNTATANNTYALTLPGISYVGSATGTTSATLPAHQVGDLILMFAYRDGNATAPTLGSGTNITTASGSTNSARLGYKIATTTSETTGTWTNATSFVAHVYRGVNSAAAIGASAVATGASTTVSYPALTMQIGDGTSWVVGFAGHRSTNTALETAPTGMTNRSTVADATDEAAGHDTAAPVASWSLKTVSVGGTSSGWAGITVELRAALPAGSAQYGDTLFWAFP